MIEKILYPSRVPFRNISSCHILALLLWMSIGISQTATAENSASLHAENCVACHAAMTGGDGEVLYTRDDRAVKSENQLTKQVDRCQSSLGLNWSNEQISSVQQFLNASFYKF